MTKRILTVIPTTGAPELRQAVDSALPGSDVLLVTDTTDGFRRTLDAFGGEDHCMREVAEGNPREAVGNPPIVVCWPFRVGGGEYGGHRIYAAVPHLVNHEYVAFLDEDNWYSPEHLPAMMATLDKGFDVAYTFRHIHAKDGTYICRDECESLGYRRGVAGRRLVDTSCWAFRTTWLRQHCAGWDAGWGADARWTDYVFDHHPNRACSNGLYSLHYRLGSSERSPKAEFFLNGNRTMSERDQAARPHQSP